MIMFIKGAKLVTEPEDTCVRETRGDFDRVGTKLPNAPLPRPLIILLTMQDEICLEDPPLERVQRLRRQ